LDDAHGAVSARVGMTLGRLSTAEETRLSPPTAPRQLTVAQTVWGDVENGLQSQTTQI